MSSDAAVAWNASWDAAVMTAFDDGVPIREIAAALDLPVRAVWDRLNTFGRITAADEFSAPVSLFPRMEFPLDFQL